MPSSSSMRLTRSGPPPRSCTGDTLLPSGRDRHAHQRGRRLTIVRGAPRASHRRPKLGPQGMGRDGRRPRKEESSAPVIVIVVDACCDTASSVKFGIHLGYTLCKAKAPYRISAGKRLLHVVGVTRFELVNSSVSVFLCCRTGNINATVTSFLPVSICHIPYVP